MKKLVFLLFFTVISVSCKQQNNDVPLSGNNQTSQETGVYYGAEIITNMGKIQIRFMQDKSPETVKNFIRYAKSGFYSGTIFHRIIKGFMIQGGGFDILLKEKRTYNPVKNEASNMIPNKRGTVSMARTPVIDSATSQFFINLVDNDFLNHGDNSDKGYGYCVFAEVISGMDVVDKIAEIPTGSSGMFQDFPQKQIIIKDVRLFDTELQDL